MYEHYKATVNNPINNHDEAHKQHKLVQISHGMDGKMRQEAKLVSLVSMVSGKGLSKREVFSPLRRTKKSIHHTNTRF